MNRLDAGQLLLVLSEPLLGIQQIGARRASTQQRSALAAYLGWSGGSGTDVGTDAAPSGGASSAGDGSGGGSGGGIGSAYGRKIVALPRLRSRDGGIRIAAGLGLEVRAHSVRL